MAVRLVAGAALLLVVADSAGLGLELADLAEVEADGAGGEGVGFGGAAGVFVVGGAEATDESVEAAPGLAERARAGAGRAGLSEEGAAGGVDLGLPELVQVAEELEHVGAAAAGEAERRAVVAEVLAESVPVAKLLRLVAAQRRERRERWVMGRRRMVLQVGYHLVAGGGGG